MAHNRLHTSTPQVDPSFPHHAPILGAQALLHEPERTLERALTDAPVPVSETMRPDPWPEVSVGVGTALLSGALTGGVAAGSWRGASIGAALSAGAWSGWTLLNGWRALGPKARTVLGVSSFVGVAGAAFGVYQRRAR